MFRNGFNDGVGIMTTFVDRSGTKNGFGECIPWWGDLCDMCATKREIVLPNYHKKKLGPRFSYYTNTRIRHIKPKQPNPLRIKFRFMRYDTNF